MRESLASFMSSVLYDKEDDTQLIRNSLEFILKSNPEVSYLNISEGWAGLGLSGFPIPDRNLVKHKTNSSNK